MEYKFLNDIETPDDLKKISASELAVVSAEVRDFIIDKVSKNGGHLGAGLGVIELTVALHYVLNTPSDKLVWDVGHQAYAHKILTGRKNRFDTNRKLGGISGFPSMSESEYDAFGTGHSSTSISAILGMAIAGNLKGDKKRNYVAVIGDASMQSGMGFEALNHAGEAQHDMLVVLNDNRMSIDPGVGALNGYLFRKSQEPFKTADSLHGTNGEEDNIFRALNFTYFGPIDGHDVDELVRILPQVLKESGPKLLHVITRKGKGYGPAEAGDATKWHAPGLFDKDTGSAVSYGRGATTPKFQDVFGRVMTDLAASNEKVVAITPAMPTGSGLIKMQGSFPERMIDVGIAEQHALTLAAGMASEGLIPVVAIYSTFLQRAYDQFIHDVAIQGLKVIFAIDRAGLVGADGTTHHGAFDIPALRTVPNTLIWCPGTEMELESMLYRSIEIDHKGPIAIRYPRGRTPDVKHEHVGSDLLKPLLLKQPEDLLVISTGPVRFNVERAIDMLDANHAGGVGHVSLRELAPDHVRNAMRSRELNHIVTVEDGAVKGGLFGLVSETLGEDGFAGTISRLGIPDRIIKHGSQEELRELAGYGPKAIKRHLENLRA